MKPKKSAIEDQRSTVEFASVDDTTLEGAQMHRRQGYRHCRGDLNIISEQDTETNSRQQSSSCGSLSVSTGSGGGNYNSQVFRVCPFARRPAHHAARTVPLRKE